MKRTAKNDFYLFAQYMMYAQNGAPMKTPPHVKKICDALTEVVVGKTKRLIINISPRAGKTELAVKLFISWCLGLNPKCQFIHTTYSHRLAASNAYAVRNYITSDCYLDLFPYVKLAQDSSAKDEFRTSDGGIVYAVGAGGSITGFGAGGVDSKFQGAIVIDDIHKAGDAESDVMRNNIIDWFSTTLESRKNNSDTPIIIIGQRLHESDLIGWLLNGGNGEHWDLLKVPAINDDGSSFWEWKFPIQDLERLERANPYVFAGQYMQEPSPRSGGLIKPYEIEVVDALPANMKFIRGWDFAATAKASADATAGAKIGIHDDIIYIADLVHFRGNPDEVEKTVVQTATLDTKEVKQSYPQDPAQAGKSQAHYLSRKLKGFNFEFTPESGDKLTRASGFISQVNVGNVKMLRGEWNSTLVKEFELIPNGKHDDILDACSRAYNALIDSNQSTLTTRRLF